MKKFYDSRSHLFKRDTFMHVSVTRLTEQQIKDLYPALLKNDPEAKRQIIESHLPLAMSVVERVIYRRKEELIEEAFWQVVMAIEDIIEKQQPEFNIGGYIHSRIWHRLKDILYHKQQKLPYQKSVQKFHDPLEFAELMGKFDDREKQIIELRMEGKVDAEISKAVGVSRERVRQIRQEIGRKVNDYR